MPRQPGPVHPGGANARDTGKDGFGNKVESFVLTHFEGAWRFVNGRSWLAGPINRVVVDRAVRKAPFRPLRLSTKADYPCWSSLTDKGWFTRYLPPMPPERLAALPATDALERLYAVRGSGPRVSDRSTLLFPTFAQWFTDGFMMTSPDDRRRTTTNHQIDLSQVYGLREEVTTALRLRSGERGRKGRLLSEEVDGEEWAPRLFGADGARDPRFAVVPDPVRMPAGLPVDRKATMFAFGGERANSTMFTAAVNTLFMREHNRLAGAIEAANPGWDDQRVFETARNVGIVQLIRIVVEEYINHVSPYWLKLLADPTACYKAGWNRENWIPVEFNLLYRWHSLVPDDAAWKDGRTSMADARFGNGPLLRDGLGAALDGASRSDIWRLGLFNTSDMLRPVELASLQQGRDNRLAGYNDYREVMGYPRMTRFEQISGEPDVVAALRDAYKDVGAVEFFVGLFAEDLPPRSAVPPLIGRMVALDAFSHALTNPLLSPHVFNEATFSREGWASIHATSTLRDLARRNLPGNGEGLRVSMERVEAHAYAGAGPAVIGA